MTLDPPDVLAPAADPRYTVVGSPVGDLTVVGGRSSTGFALTGVFFPGHRHPPTTDVLGRFAGARAPEFDPVRQQLAEYFDGIRTVFTLPLAPAGPPFRQRVWTLLRAIPYGETRSYGALATELGDRNLAQAVGAANARNPLSVVVPCHRVVAANGDLTGFAGGLERKRWLLDLETPADVRLC